MAETVTEDGVTFINIVHGSPSTRLVEEEEGKDPFVSKVAVWRQCRALFLKDLTLQWRSVGTNLCQLLTPIIFICFAGIMQVIINDILASHHVPVPGSQSYLIPMDVSRLVVCSSYIHIDPFNHPSLCRDELFSAYAELDWKAMVDWAENMAVFTNNMNILNFTEVVRHLETVSYVPRQQVLFNLPYYYVGKSEEVDWDLGYLTFDGKRAGFIGSTIPDSWYYNFSTSFNISPYWPLIRMMYLDHYRNSVGPYLKVPFFLPIENRAVLNERLIKVVNHYNDLVHSSSETYDQYQRNYIVTPLSQDQYTSVLYDVKNGTASADSSYFEEIRPYGGILVDHLSHSPSSPSEGRPGNFSLAYTMVVDDLVLYEFTEPGSPTHTTDNEVHRRNNIINMMSNALFKNLTGLPAGADAAIVTYIMPMPGISENITIDLTSLLGGVLYPFASSFLIPVFVSALVKDKSERQLIMMEQNGLNQWTYWLVTYCFNYSLYAIIFVVITVFSLIFQIRLFTQTNPLVLIVVFLMWGHSQVIFGFFLANFFSRPRTATIIGYFVVISGVVISLIVELLQIFPDDKTPFPLYMLYPPLAFYRILHYMNMACLSLQCFSLSILSDLNLTTTALLYLIGSTLCLIVLSPYFSAVLPSEYGVRKSPFFPIIAVWKAARYMLRMIGMCRVKCLQDSGEGTAMFDEENLDEDVRAEEESLSMGFPPNAPVVIYQLRKEYSRSGGRAPHVAVQNVSLAIQRNECFGLLGPNGAGKTTLISVLTGLYEPSRGTARIAGYDITTEMSKVHHHLGVCPQFDIQHADLTPEEHLLFYARLKGVRRSQEKAVVSSALQQVNLYDVRRRKSKALSGGMRRRLSVAMACIGSPDILILDEPTTGLDPASRRQVWEVIQRVKKGRSVILTTHAMEEADNLCTRIGIMNFGYLRCLGTQSHLKARFGCGYQLQFNCAPGRVGAVEEFIRNLLPKAVHMETFADSSSFKLEREDLVVSELFQQMDQAKVELGVLDWGIKMTTLEDVFLNIVRQSQDPENLESPSYCPAWFPCPCSNKERGLKLC